MKQQSQVYLDTNRPLQSIFLPLIKSALASQPSKLTIFSSLLTSGQHAHCLPSPVILPLTNTEFQLLQKTGGGGKHGWFKPFVLLSPLRTLLHHQNSARNPQKKKNKCTFLKLEALSQSPQWPHHKAQSSLGCLRLLHNTFTAVGGWGGRLQKEEAARSRLWGSSSRASPLHVSLTALLCRHLGEWLWLDMGSKTLKWLKANAGWA